MEQVSKNIAGVVIIPHNKILKILVLGGGPIGLFAGYKLLKKGHDVTIFEKRKKYTRHNILSLEESTKIDTLSIIPSEIMDELNEKSSFSNIISQIDSENKKCFKNVLRNKPYLMVSSRVYYIVLSELEAAYEKYYKLAGGKLIRPQTTESFNDIFLENNIIKYKEENNEFSINISEYDIIFINDGANSYYRNIYFQKTSYVENIEHNILRYGLNEEQNAIKIANEINDVKPLSYGLILIYNIDNKEEFLDKFMTEDKLKKKTDFDSVLKLDNGNSFMNGLSVKEILVQSSKINNSPLKSQNLFRMFISENYLYISIMANPKDVGDFANNLGNGNIKYNDIPESIKTYIMFALYYYDLSELIDPNSSNFLIKIFPLTISCVKQSCTFIKKDKQIEAQTCQNTGVPKNLQFSEAPLATQGGTVENKSPIKDPQKSRKEMLEDSSVYFPSDKSIVENMDRCDMVQPKENYYQLLILCGDAMCSGNFHAGIVLNKNLLAVNNLCQLIDEYIDSYPKDKNCNLNNNLLRLLFFKGNLHSQNARNEILEKSIDALINFSELDKDEQNYSLPDILSEFKDIIVCKNCNEKNKLMCKNSASFIKFIIDKSDDDVLKRILKYLFLPNKYKYNYNKLHNSIEVSEAVFN